jgi:antitoxin HicB
MMKTSRSSLDRLLDPDNTSVTLSTMIRAASIMNKKLNITLNDAKH